MATAIILSRTTYNSQEKLEHLKYRIYFSNNSFGSSCQKTSSKIWVRYILEWFWVGGKNEICIVSSVLNGKHEEFCSGIFLLNAVEESWLLTTTCAHCSLSVAGEHVLAAAVIRQMLSSDLTDFTCNKKGQFPQFQVLNRRIHLIWTALQVWIVTLRGWISIVCC